jgi:hypothetical protein
MSRIVPIAVALTIASLSALSCTARPQQRPDPVSEPTGECTLQWREPSPAEAESKVVAPFSLTAQDGTGLELISLTSRAVVEDPLAFTELKMVFRNPEDRQIEGRFEINLPPGAAISRFAMLIGDRWQEAEVVELQAARRAYEDFLHRRQDPALLEKNAGNTFSARVFPIPARGVKEIIVSYSESLPSNAEPYRLLLRGLPQLQDLDVDVVVPRASGPEHLTLREKNFMPQKDLELTTGRRSAEVGLRYDRLAVARISPDIKLPQENLTGLTLLFDTSASRAIDFRGQVARLGKIVEELRAAAGVDFDLRVLCFDQTVEQVFSGKASSFSADAQQTILTRSPLGASDLTGALNFVKQHSAGHDRLIVVSDGILTAGEQERDKLRAAAGDLKYAGVRRIDAIVDGGTQDEISLRQLTVAGLERDGIVVNARMPAPLLASRVLRATRSGMKVTVPGAAWVWPETLDAVQPGDQVLVFADLPPGSDMRVELGEGEARVVALQTAERPLLERAWVKASIDRLTAMLSDGVAATTDAAKADIRKQILDLSTKYRVLSDYTALLVLETEWDYQRFGIDRTALAEILTVGPAGITTIDRSRLPDKTGVAAARPIDPPTHDAPRKSKGLLGDLFDGEDDARAEAKMDTRDADKDSSDSSPRAASAPASAGEPAPGRAPQSAPMDALADPTRPDPSPPPPPPPVMRDEPAPEAVQEEEIAMPRRILDAEPSRERSEAKRATRRPPPHGGATSGDSNRRPISPISQPPQPQPRPAEFPKPTDAYEGRFGAVMAKVTAGDRGGALRDAWTWREENPGDELALIALGEVAEA